MWAYHIDLVVFNDRQVNNSDELSKLVYSSFNHTLKLLKIVRSETRKYNVLVWVPIVNRSSSTAELNVVSGINILKILENSIKRVSWGLDLLWYQICCLF